MSEHSGLTSIAERRQIVARLDGLFSEIDESEAALERARRVATPASHAALVPRCKN
ncbi:MAG TPA: hypothetical protein VJ349_08045 [Stellaceae bacterium]|nr:hypothetical protein [Stellaceae bacterium]